MSRRYTFHSPSTIFAVFIHHESAAHHQGNNALSRRDVCGLLVDRLLERNDDLVCVMIKPAEGTLRLTAGELVSSSLAVQYDHFAGGFSHRNAVDRYDILFQLKAARATEHSSLWAYALLHEPVPFPGLHAVSIPASGNFDSTQILGFLDDLTVVRGPKPDTNPRLDRKAMLMYLERFGPQDDKLDVLGWIREYYSASNVGETAIENVYIEWRKQRKIPESPRRLQDKGCSWPEELMRERPEEWKHPFVPAKAPQELRDWPAQHLGRRLVRMRDKTIVVTGRGGRGRTHFVRSWGPHVYMYKAVDRELLYDCIRDGKAQYIVLDDIPWPTLLQHYEGLLSGQSEMSWKNGRTTRTTHQPLPVIVIANGQPKQYYPPRDAMYWTDFLHFVPLDPSTFLYDNTRLITDQSRSEASSASSSTASTPTSAIMRMVMPRLEEAVREQVKSLLDMAVEATGVEDEGAAEVGDEAVSDDADEKEIVARVIEQADAVPSEDAGDDAAATTTTTSTGSKRKALAPQRSHRAKRRA